MSVAAVQPLAPAPDPVAAIVLRLINGARVSGEFNLDRSGRRSFWVVSRLADQIDSAARRRDQPGNDADNENESRNLGTARFQKRPQHRRDQPSSGGGQREPNIARPVDGAIDRAKHAQVSP